MQIEARLVIKVEVAVEPTENASPRRMRKATRILLVRHHANLPCLTFYQIAKFATEYHHAVLPDVIVGEPGQPVLDPRLHGGRPRKVALPVAMHEEEFEPPFPHRDGRRRLAFDQQTERVREPDRLVQVSAQVAARHRKQFDQPVAVVATGFRSVRHQFGHARQDGGQGKVPDPFVGHLRRIVRVQAEVGT